MSKRNLDNEKKKVFEVTYGVDIAILIVIFIYGVIIISTHFSENFIFDYKYILFEPLCYTLGAYIYLVIGKKIKSFGIHFLILVMFVIDFLLLLYNKWM